MKSGRSLAWVSLLAMAALACLLWATSRPPGSTSSRPLLVYCAAGLKGPVEAAAKAYEKETGTAVQLQFGGSGTLLSNLRVSGQGDVFVAAGTAALWRKVCLPSSNGFFTADAGGLFMRCITALRSWIGWVACVCIPSMIW